MLDGKTAIVTGAGGGLGRAHALYLASKGAKILVNDVTVDAAGMLFVVRKDGSQVCLAMASLSYEDQTPIIGNYQQKNKRVVYDTVGSRLGFADEDCSYV